MKSEQSGYSTIDEYIATFPEDIQKKLQEIRATVKAAAPEAEEKISYQMPAFALNGNLVYFAAFQKHIGFFPTPSGIEEFRADLAAYPGSKGSIHFPLDRPIPFDLISRIVKFRAAENIKNAELKKQKKKAQS